MAEKLKRDEVENSEFRRCTQIQCGFYLNGGCKACEYCKAPSFVLIKSCDRCWRCENIPNELRFGDDKLQQDIKVPIIEDEGVVIIMSSKPSKGLLEQERKMEREIMR